MGPVGIELGSAEGAFGVVAWAEVVVSLPQTRSRGRCGSPS